MLSKRNNCIACVASVYCHYGSLHLSATWCGGICTVTLTAGNLWTLYSWCSEISKWTLQQRAKWSCVLKLCIPLRHLKCFGRLIATMLCAELSVVLGFKIAEITGRPCTSTTPNNVNKIQPLVSADHRITVHDIAHVVGHYVNLVQLRQSSQAI